MDNFQRIGSISNAHVGKEFVGAVKEYFKAQGTDLDSEFGVDIGFKSKKRHKFDLGSHKERILIECKSYTWTSGGNSPSAKIRGLNEAMLHFSVTPENWRKILVMAKNMRGDQSLGEHYLRTQGHLIGEDVEVWEFDEQLKTANRLL